jgi:hypothetical protein
MHGILQKGEITDTGTGQEMVVWPQRQRTEALSHKPKDIKAF